jgi:hypothetical protein
MREADLRKWHRTIGIIAALFIILQAGTGLVLTLIDLTAGLNHGQNEIPSTGHFHGQDVSLWQDVLEFFHLGGAASAQCIGFSSA